METYSDVVREHLYRCDYAKFAVEVEPDRIQTLYKEWARVFEFTEGEGQHENSLSFKSVRINSDGTRLYIFQVWGERAANIRYLDWIIWSKYLDRIDVREECDVTRAGIEALYDHTVGHNSGRRNVQLFTSRPRSKRDGRPAGGDGLAIGSHKSDFRFSVYKRGGERGACEFQLSGEFLNRARAVVDMVQQQGDARALQDPWGNLLTMLRAQGWKELLNTVALGREDVQLIAAGDNLRSVLIEETLARMEADFNALPRELQESLMVSFQHTLFD